MLPRPPERRAGCATSAVVWLSRSRPARRLRRQPARGPSVTFTGPVQNFAVAWRVGLMLTQAIVSANYMGNGDPSVIVIHRSGQDIPIDPKQLLNGGDFLLEAGDVI